MKRERERERVWIGKLNIVKMLVLPIWSMDSIKCKSHQTTSKHLVDISKLALKFIHMESQNPSIANLTLKNKAGVLTLRDSKIYLRAIKLKKNCLQYSY